MKTYKVVVSFTGWYVAYIEAADQEEADALAQEDLENGDLVGEELEYTDQQVDSVIEEV